MSEVAPVLPSPYVLMEEYRQGQLERDIDAYYHRPMKDLQGCCLMCGWVKEECKCGKEQDGT